MISRFFKKKPTKSSEPKKAASESSREKPVKFKKLLTAEGWKRMMMRKMGKPKS